MARRTDTGFTALRIEGGLFPSEFLLTVAAAEAGDQDNAAYGLTRSLHLRDEIGRFFRIAADLHADFRARPDDARAAVDGWLAPLLAQVFGYRALEPLRAPLELEERRFPITHLALDGAVPLVLVPPALGLDTSDARFGDEGRRRTAMGLVQEFLNASEDHLWGLASDGRVLRLLRKRSPWASNIQELPAQVVVAFVADEALPKGEERAGDAVAEPGLGALTGLDRDLAPALEDAGGGVAGLARLQAAAVRQQPEGGEIRVDDVLEGALEVELDPRRAGEARVGLKISRKTPSPLRTLSCEIVRDIAKLPIFFALA